MSIDQMDCRRRSRRLKIFLPASLVRGGETLRIHLLDVSRGGALAHGEVPPRANERVLLRCEGLHVTAVVKWVSDKRFGLMFSVPLTEHVLRALLGDGLPDLARLPPLARPAGIRTLQDRGR